MFAYITLALIWFYVNARVPSRNLPLFPAGSVPRWTWRNLDLRKKRPKKRTRRKKKVVLSSGLLTSGNLSPVDSVVTRGRREIMRDLCRPARSFDCYIFTVFCDGKLNRIVATVNRDPGNSTSVKNLIWTGRKFTIPRVSCWRCDSLVSSRATRVVSSKLETRQLVAFAISAFFFFFHH